MKLWLSLLLLAGAAHGAVILTPPSGPVVAVPVGGPDGGFSRPPVALGATKDDPVDRSLVGQIFTALPAGFSVAFPLTGTVSSFFGVSVSSPWFLMDRTVLPGDYTVSFRGLVSSLSPIGTPEPTNVISMVITVPSAAAVPEPATYLLTLAGAAAIAVFRRRGRER